MVPPDADQLMVCARAVPGDVTAETVVVPPEKRAVFTGATSTSSMCTTVTVAVALIAGFLWLLAVMVTCVNPKGIPSFAAGATYRLFFELSVPAEPTFGLTDQSTAPVGSNELGLKVTVNGVFSPATSSSLSGAAVSVSVTGVRLMVAVAQLLMEFLLHP